MDESIEFLTETKLRSKFLIAEYWIAMVSLSALLWLVILANDLSISILLISFQVTILVTFGYLIHYTSAKLKNVVTVLDILSSVDPEAEAEMKKYAPAMQTFWLDLTTRTEKYKPNIDIPKQSGHEQGQEGSEK
jgi:hypothetical protein